MNQLALVYEDAGELDKALPLFEQILKLRQDTLGLEHPHTLMSTNNLTCIRVAQSRLANSDKSYNGTVQMKNAPLRSGKDNSFVHAGLLPLTIADRDGIVSCNSHGHDLMIEVWTGGGLDERELNSSWAERELVASSDGRVRDGQEGTGPSKDPSLMWVSHRGHFRLFFAHWPQRCGCNTEDFQVDVEIH
jgi:hypothetical protein